MLWGGRRWPPTHHIKLLWTSSALANTQQAHQCSRRMHPRLVATSNAWHSWCCEGVDILPLFNIQDPPLLASEGIYVLDVLDDIPYSCLQRLGSSKSGNPSVVNQRCWFRLSYAFVRTTNKWSFTDDIPSNGQITPTSRFFLISEALPMTLWKSAHQ